MYPTIRDQDLGNQYRCVYRQDATNHPRDLSCELRYLRECPRLRELNIMGGRDIVMEEWTSVLNEVYLNIL